MNYEKINLLMVTVFAIPALLTFSHSVWAGKFPILDPEKDIKSDGKCGRYFAQQQTVKDEKNGRTYHYIDGDHVSIDKQKLQTIKLASGNIDDELFVSYTVSQKNGYTSNLRLLRLWAIEGDLMPKVTNEEAKTLAKSAFQNQSSPVVLEKNGLNWQVTVCCPANPTINPNFEEYNLSEEVSTLSVHSLAEAVEQGQSRLCELKRVWEFNSSKSSPKLMVILKTHYPIKDL